MNAKEAKRLTLEVMRKNRPMIDGFIYLIKAEIEKMIAIEEFSLSLEKIKIDMNQDEFALVRFFMEEEGYEFNNKYFGGNGKNYHHFDITWGQEDVD